MSDLLACMRCVDAVMMTRKAAGGRERGFSRAATDHFTPHSHFSLTTFTVSIFSYLRVLKKSVSHSSFDAFPHRRARLSRHASAPSRPGSPKTARALPARGCDGNAPMANAFLVLVAVLG